MNTLCARLRNLEEAGIYQLNCSADELRSRTGKGERYPVASLHFARPLSPPMLK